MAIEESSKLSQPERFTFHIEKGMLAEIDRERALWRPIPSRSELVRELLTEAIEARNRRAK